jgi:hypothetical protein
VRLVLIIIFIPSLLFFVQRFLKRMLQKWRFYTRWYKLEVDTLSEHEKERRFFYCPEILRKFRVMLDIFVLFEIIFYIMSFGQIIVWIIQIVFNAKAAKPLPIDDHSYPNTFQFILNYTETKSKNIAGLTSIFVGLNLLKYMEKIKAVKSITKSLIESMSDIFYFFCFYFILMTGFMCMAHVTFGT